MSKARATRAALLVAATAALVLGGCGDDGDGNGDSQEIGELFIQSAAGGSFEQRGGELTLTLTGVSPATTTFADRPERHSGTMATEDFTRSFGLLFEDAKPNATLSSLEHGKGEFVVELSKPRFDAKTATLTYGAAPVDRPAEEFPASFGDASLFVDDSTGIIGTGKWTTSATVAVVSQHGDPCRASGISGQPVLTNPTINEAPDQWADPPPDNYQVHQGEVELFRAASRHGSTHFDVTYDINCDVGNFGQIGTIRFHGSTPQSAFNKNTFNCELDLSIPNVSVPVEGLEGECRNQVDSGYHPWPTAVLTD